MPKAPNQNSDKLEQAEREMSLYGVVGGSQCLLLAKLGLATHDDLVPSPDFGGSVYTRLTSPQEINELQGSPLLTRPLNGGGSLQVIATDKSYFYRVVDGDGKPVEVGEAIEGDKLSSRYAELLRCVSVTEPQKILRDWKFGGSRFVPSNILNEALGTALSGSLLVELIPITNTFRVSSYSTSSRSSGFGFEMQESQSKVLFRGTMASPGYLKLVKAIQEQTPGWGT
jgi:hypothetical protein